MTELFRPKPWEFKGRRMERNAPSGTLCSVSPWCVGPRPTPSQAHCSVCHETFGGVTLFDKHRRDGWCLNPAALGLSRSGAGVWRTDLPDDARARLRALDAQNC